MDTTVKKQPDPVQAKAKPKAPAQRAEEIVQRTPAETPAFLRSSPRPGEEEPAPAVRRKPKPPAVEEVDRKAAEDTPLPKLEVGAPDSPLEREADQVAQTVMRTESSASIGRNESEPDIVRRKEAQEREVACAPGEQPADGPDEIGAMKAMERAGDGAPLKPEVAATLSSRLGEDLSDVRVHEGSAAEEAAAALQARAFTYQGEVWLGRGESQDDLALMAHEVTHVLQQGGGGRVSRTVLRQGGGTNKSKAAESDGEPKRELDPETGILLPSKKGARNGKLMLPSLPVPDFKEPAFKGKKIYRRAGYDRGSPGQARLWDSEVSSEGTLKKLKSGNFGMVSDRIYNLITPRKKGKEGVYDRLGTPEAIAPTLVRPFWSERGYDPHHVDHIVELQVSGWPRARWANKLTNMEMLDEGSNTSSGKAIRENVVAEIDKALKDSKKGKVLRDGGYKDAEAIKKSFDVHFEATAPQKFPGPSRYSRGTIESGGHIDSLEKAILADKRLRLVDISGGEQGGPTNPLYSKNLKKPENLLGSDRKLVVYLNQGKARRRTFDFKKNVSKAPGKKATLTLDKKVNYPYGLELSSVDYTPGKDTVAVLHGTLFKKQKEKFIEVGAPPKGYPVKKMPGTEFAGYIDTTEFRRFKDVQFKGASPVVFDDVYIDEEEGVTLKGRIQATLPILEGVEIDLILQGDDLRVEKTFDTGDFKLPGPIQVTSSSLTLSGGIKGVGISGEAAFEIQGIGEGGIQASAKSGFGGKGRGFELSGNFDFDSKLFDPASVEMAYADEKFSIAGKLGIKKGTVPGVGKATIEVGYGEGVLSATGDAELLIPGVEKGKMSVRYSEAEGFEVGGSFNLSKDVPGIESGSVEAKVRRKEGEERYSLSAKGTAAPSIPGIDTTLTVAYDDGIFTVEGEASYKRGLLDGSAKIGVTNRPIDKNGTPAGEEPTEKLTVYGGGQVGVKLTPWLRGEAGIRLLPNGEIELSGAIKLPEALELFKKKELEKNLFTVNIDIPIVGVAAAGQRIGIFATIGGGATLTASFGPGELTELGLGVTYNPDREEETKISGGAKLVVPAFAGVRLFVKGGLGAGIPLVSATAGLEVGGEIGVAGALEAGVDVDWTPAKGLVLDAVAEIYAEPKFKFDITGFVLVEFSVWVKKWELYSKRWQLAALEYGSGLRLGAKFPIHYEEGQPFDLSLNQIEFQVPDINPTDVLKGLVKQIT